MMVYRFTQLSRDDRARSISIKIMDSVLTLPVAPLSEQPSLLRISQSQLNLLETCPRKFQQVYLEQLAAPTSPEQQERQMWGTRFHRLLQQWQLGLPVEPLVLADSQLHQWFTDFVNAAPQILTLDAAGGEIRQQSEHARTLEFHGYLLTVVYDLLLSDDRQAQILDWKTYPRPQTPRWLMQNWQTRLYPFVLAETSAYQPEQISMTYWFFQTSGLEAESQPQSFRLTYDRTQHEQTRQDLSQLLTQLTHWLTRYQAGEPFPQVAQESTQCDSCSFASRCDRQAQAEEKLVDLPVLAIAEIQEIPL